MLNLLPQVHGGGLADVYITWFVSFPHNVHLQSFSMFEISFLQLQRLCYAKTKKKEKVDKDLGLSFGLRKDGIDLFSFHSSFNTATLRSWYFQRL